MTNISYSSYILECTHPIAKYADNAHYRTWWIQVPRSCMIRLT